MRKKMRQNKKGIIQFGIIAVVIAVIVVGFLAFNPFKAKASGLTEEQVNALLEKQTKQQQNQPPPVVCGTGTTLQEGKCVVISNDKNRIDDGAELPSVPPSPLIPPPATNVECREPSGVFTSLYYRQRNFVKCGFESFTCKAQVWGTFRYHGNCPADIYIEAGIPNDPQSPNPLAIAPSGFISAVKGQPSACDGKVNWNGVVFKQLTPNQVVMFKLTPENYGVEGTYPIGIGAYTGCLKDNGKEVQVLSPKWVGFSNKYERGTSNPNKDIDLSWVQII